MVNANKKHIEQFISNIITAETLKETIKFRDLFLDHYKHIEMKTRLGEGDYGIAYLLKDGRVLKITTDKTEIDAASIIVGESVSNVAEIYDIKITKKKYYTISAVVKVHIGFIIQEYIPYSIEDYIGKILTDLTRQIKRRYGLRENTSRSVLKKASKKLAEYMLDGYEPDFEVTEDEQKDITNSLLQVANGIIQLYKHGIYYVDAHINNVRLTKNDEYKIIDLGYGSAIRKKDNITKINKP